MSANTPTEVFDEFTKSCNETFAFLETENGLRLHESEQCGREFVVVFANEKYRVSIYFEYPGPPWIAIEKK